jgi:TM2 domain-containing membrane protein YozV
MNQQKDPFLAGVLSFFIPGAGHMYCGEVGVGIAFFFGTIVAYAAFIIPGLFTHGFAVYLAYNKAKDINYQIESVEQQRHIDQKKVADLGNKIKADEFAEKLKKVHKLHANNIYSDKEYKEKKKAIISELASKKINCEPDDFLASLVVLKEQNVLDSEEINKIKTFII